jgi:5-methylcytosine-specific restriction protein B
MNLAHVERYFADVLSGIESRASVLPDLERTPEGWFPRREGGRIPLPRNVFIVGTVNVDETTYLFSPKVLDRANTIEFRMTNSAFPDDPAAARKPGTCSPGPAELIAGFLAIAVDDAWHERWVTNATETVAALRGLHEGLAEHAHEFGHRTFYEGIRLMGLLQAAGVDALDDRLDVFVLQKILPRLHGARRKLEPVLRGLGAFTFDRRPLKDAASFEFQTTMAAPGRLPRSHRKLQRMMGALRANQFASFSD